MAAPSNAVRDLSVAVGTALVSGLNLTVAQGERLFARAERSGQYHNSQVNQRLLEPNEGEIFYLGAHCIVMGPDPVAARIGYVIQDVGLFPHWSVEKNVRAGATTGPWPEDRIHARVKEMLSWSVFLLLSSPRAPIRTLPAGKGSEWEWRGRWRRTLPILLMDEPFVRA